LDINKYQSMDYQNEKQNISKVLTGIAGLDQITLGGLPYARPTLVSGGAGSGKTALAMQFILNGINMFDDPGVFISLEESEEDLRINMASFGYDITEMEDSGMLSVENIKLQRTTLYKSGYFDLSPLLIRIEEAVNNVNARRIAIDTFELIFNDIQDENVFRQELIKLISWLKKQKLTAIFTSEKPADGPFKPGIEEFITDCVIELKHKMVDDIYTRRMHILKYRGSGHGTNEYPFVIDENGISILPITSEEIHHISDKIISTGIRGLDDKIGKNGFYIGSSTLISGLSGTGKTSFSVSVCVEALKQQKKCLFFTFEESVSQLKRNMKPLGFDLDHYEKEGLLKIVSTRPSLFGIETHLVSIYRDVENFDPELVVFDPVTDLIQVGPKFEVRSMLLRIIDYLKNRLITIIFTSLISSADSERRLGMSSMVDNWISLEYIEYGHENIPSLRIIKIRGMKHSRDKFVLNFTGEGLMISDFENTRP